MKCCCVRLPLVFLKVNFTKNPKDSQWHQYLTMNLFFHEWKLRLKCHCCVLLTPRQGISARPSDERGHRDLGEAAPERHSHRQQLGDVQPQRTQHDAQLRVRLAHSAPLWPSRAVLPNLLWNRAAAFLEPCLFFFSRPSCFLAWGTWCFSAPPTSSTQNDPFVFLAAYPRITVFGLYVCLSVRLFQGGLSGETESGHRLPHKRRLQKRLGPTHPGETDRQTERRQIWWFITRLKFWETHHCLGLY